MIPPFNKIPIACLNRCQFNAKTIASKIQELESDEANTIFGGEGGMLQRVRNSEDPNTALYTFCNEWALLRNNKSIIYVIKAAIKCGKIELAKFIESEIEEVIKKIEADGEESAGKTDIKTMRSYLAEGLKNLPSISLTCNIKLPPKLELKNVPQFDGYFARNSDDEENFRKGLYNLAERDNQNDSNGFCFVIHGCGGAGKSTLVAHVLRNDNNLIQQCKIQIVIWLNCYKWREGLNNSSEDPKSFIRELLDLGKEIVREQTGETKQFGTLKEMIRHFHNQHQKRILFVLDDVFDISILLTLREKFDEDLSSICCAITRDADKWKNPASGFETFFKCRDGVANPLKVGYLSDDRVRELLEANLKGQLNPEQLERLVRMSCGLPLIVNLVLGHFNGPNYLGDSQRAFRDLTEKHKLGDFEVNQSGLGRGEKQAKQLFDFSFQSLQGEDKERYFMFLLFDPVKEVDFEWLKDLWQIEDDGEARAICYSFERLSLVRHIAIESEDKWERKDCYLVHQILWEQTLENAKQEYQLSEMPTVALLTQKCRCHILTHRNTSQIAEPVGKGRNLHLASRCLFFCIPVVETGSTIASLESFDSPEPDALVEILSNIKNDEISSWSEKEVRKIKQFLGSYEKQIISTARTNHAFLTRLLIKNGANIEAKDKFGKTPLIWASEKGHIEVVKLLIKKGANVEAKDKEDRTSLSWASENGHIEVVTFLIEKKANIVAKDDYDTTPLMWASVRGRIDIVKLLIKKGAYIEAKDKLDHTPLISASINGHIEVVKLLIEEKANIEAKDKGDRTPLIWASWYGQIEVVKFLIEKGANIEAKDKEDTTPLILAFGKRQIEFVKLLIEKGANIEAKNQLFFGGTPLIWASVNGHIEFVKLLIEKGANIEAKDKFDSTPLIEASKYGHIEVVKLLKEKGAKMEEQEKQTTPRRFY